MSLVPEILNHRRPGSLYRRLLEVSSLSLLLCVPALAGTSHQHGTSTLDVVFEGRQLSVSLNSPLDDLVGFEHPPRTAKQQSALQGMSEKMREGARWLQTDGSAACSLQSARVQHPYAAAAQEAQAHAEARVDWLFLCAQPENLRRLDVLLFDAFPGIQRLKVQAITPQGQRGAVLSPGKRRLSL